jgi:hypothetical protein
VANLLLFIPLGISLLVWRAIGWSRVWQIVLLAVVLSATIEVVQFLGLVDGRIASLWDIVFNTIGALAGGLLAFAAPSLVQPSKSSARVLFASWCVVTHVVLFASAWALQRAPRVTLSGVPRPSSLPFTTGFGWFEQPITAAVVDGAAFERQDGSGAIIVTAPERAAHALHVRVEGRDRRLTFVPMLFVHAAGDAGAHLMIGQRGNDYALMVRVNAARLGMQMPALALEGSVGYAGTPAGGPAGSHHVDIGAAITSRQWVLSAKRQGETADSASLSIRPVLGWLLILPIRNANGPPSVVGTAIVVFLLSAPLFFWGAIGISRRINGLLVSAIASMFALVMPAWWADQSMPSLLDVMALVVASATLAMHRPQPKGLQRK